MSEELSQVDEVTETEEEVDAALDDAAVDGMSVDDLKKELAKTRREAASRRVTGKDVAAQLAELKALKERDMTELQKAQARAAELEEYVAADQFVKLQRKCAKAVGLSLEWADRVRGESEADMLEDAKALLAKTGKATKAASITSRGTVGSPVGQDANEEGDWLRQALKGSGIQYY